MRSLLFIFLLTSALSFGQSSLVENESIDKKTLLNNFNEAKKYKKDTLLIITSKQLARVYAKELSLDSALYFEKYCNQKLTNIFLPNIHIKNLIGLGEIYKMRKEYDSALIYFTKSEQYLKQNDTLNRSFLVLTKIRKQQAYFDKEDYKTALKLLEEAYSLSNKINNKEYENIITYSYSQLYYKLEQPEKAIAYLKQAIQNKKNTQEALNYYHPLISIFNEYNQKDSSIFYLKQAIVLSEKVNNPIFKNIFYLYIAAAIDDTVQKKRYLTKIDTANLINEFKSIYFLNKAQLSESLNQQIVNSEVALTLTNDPTIKSKIYYFLYEVYKSNNLEKSLLFLEKYNTIQDSIQDKESKQIIEKAILSNKLDSKNSEIDTHKNTKLRYFIFALTIVFIAILIVLGAIFIFKKQKQTNINLAEEKEKLFKDRVKINNELSEALFEIEKNISFLKNSRKELSEIRNKNEVNSQLNNLYARFNQYITDINRNKDIQNKINDLKNDFFNRIEENVKLTNTDKKLIMLIKLNMPSKEIAPLLNITETSVEKYRYRLRKKLNIDKEIPLKKYIKNL